jgi:hypothetical protein
MKQLLLGSWQDSRMKALFKNVFNDQKIILQEHNPDGVPSLLSCIRSAILTKYEVEFFCQRYNTADAQNKTGHFPRSQHHYT